MKLLLDESVPRRLASSFPEAFTLRTVQEMGWAGTGNGCQTGRVLLRRDGTIPPLRLV